MELSVGVYNKTNEQNWDLFPIISQYLLEDEIASPFIEDETPQIENFTSKKSYLCSFQSNSAQLDERQIQDSPSIQIQEKKNFLYKKYCSNTPKKVNKKQQFFKNNLKKIEKSNLDQPLKLSENEKLQKLKVYRVKIHKLKKKQKYYQQMKLGIFKTDLPKNKSDQENNLNQSDYASLTLKQLNEKEQSVTNRINRLSKRIEQYDIQIRKISSQKENENENEI